MPLTLTSRRLFGVHGAGLIFCVPADELTARAELDHRGILASGPWIAHLAPDGLRLGEGAVEALAWHVNARDKLRLDGAGLLDPDRISERW